MKRIKEPIPKKLLHYECPLCHQLWLDKKGCAMCIKNDIKLKTVPCSCCGETFRATQVLDGMCYDCLEYMISEMEECNG